MHVGRATMASSDHSPDSQFRSEYERFCRKVSEDFVSKLKVVDGSKDELFRGGEEAGSSEGSERNPPDSVGECSSGLDGEQLQEEEEEEHEEDADGQEDGEEEDKDEDEFDFSFACVNPDGSPIAADTIFQNGQIRPMYPLFDQTLLFDSERQPNTVSYPMPPLRKLFVERAGEQSELEGVDQETYCMWNGKTVEDASPESCRKSNSTGFSKLWRFRDLGHRSNSDGKDVFVFLNPSKAGNTDTTKQKARKVAESVKKDDKEKVKTAVAAKKGQRAAPSAHEQHYVRNRAVKESDRRKSYLPYRQDLVGFFANVNGMSKNVHPY